MAKKEKKDKATIKAEKAAKKANMTPEEKDANIALVIKCIAAILCAVILALNISSAFKDLAEAVEASPVANVSVSAGTSNAGSSDDVTPDAGSDVVTPDATTPDAGTDATTPDAGTDATTPDAGTDATTPDAGADTGSKAPSSPAEVVAYFNTAVNKVKTSAKAVEQKNVTNYLASSPTIPSALNSIYKMLGGDSWLDETLQKESQGAVTYTGADIKAKFPVEGETWASKLAAGDVSNATCTESNGVYTIKLTTLADAKSDAHKHGQGHNPKVHNVILPGVVNDNIPGIAKSLVGTAAMGYPASTVTITVDAKTGNVLTADYDLKWTINFDKMGAVIPLGTKSSYTIKW